MIHKYYEVTCDNCKCLIDIYSKKPTHTQLRRDGAKIRLVNGNPHIFCCNDCYDKMVKSNK